MRDCGERVFRCDERRLLLCLGGREVSINILGIGKEEVNDVPFLIAFAFSALRWACAGFTDFSFGILGVGELGKRG